MPDRDQPSAHEEIWQRHELSDRNADGMVSGVECLLYDAISDLEIALSDVEATQSVTVNTLELMREAIRVAEDACILGADANKEPRKGRVELSTSGGLIWKPIEHEDPSNIN